MQHEPAAQAATPLPLPPHLLQLQDALEKSTRAIEQKALRLSQPPPKTSTKGRKAVELVNPFYGIEELREYPAWAEDVLQGIARLDWYRPGERSIPLSVRRLVRILASLPAINTASISQFLLLEQRQARRYLQAVKLAMPHLIRSCPPGLSQREAANGGDFDDLY